MISLKPHTAGTIPTIPCLTPPANYELEHDTFDVHPAYDNFYLPLPPRPTRPRARLGQIFWPCWGMSRFAVGHVLVSAAAYAEMLAVSDWVSGYGRGITVALTDDRNDPVELEMQVISARPFNDPKAEAGIAVGGEISQAWILTLTDFRWPNQGTMTQGSGPLGDSIWARNIRNYLTTSGFSAPSAADIDTVLGAFSPAYPDALQEWWTYGIPHNISGLIACDASCAGVNLRVSFDGANNTEVQGPNEAASAWAAWLADWSRYSINGGLIDSVAEKPWYVNCNFLSSANEETSSVALATTGVYSTVTADLNYLTSSGDRSDYKTRYTDDVGRWLDIQQFDGALAGFVPPPAAAIPYAVVYRSDAGHAETRVMKSPAQYPWPLSGKMGVTRLLWALAASPGVSTTKTPPVSITAVNGIVTAMS